MAAGYMLVPMVLTALNTVSSDDAYVNGHVTFVAPRVAGPVTAVLVDNNQRVKAGDLLVTELPIILWYRCGSGDRYFGVTQYVCLIGRLYASA